MPEKSENAWTDELPLSRDRLLEGLVTGSAGDSFIDRYNEQYGFDFPWRTYHIGLVDTGRTAVDSELFSNMESLVRNFINDNFHGYVFLVEGRIGILFRNASLLSLPRILRMLQEKVRSSFGLTVTISLGNSVDSSGMLPASYLQACRLLDRKFLYGHKNIVIRADESNTGDGAETGGIQDPGLERLPEDMFYAMGMKNIVFINNLLEELKNRQIKCRLDERSIRTNYKDLYMAVIGRLDAGCETIRPFLDEAGEVQKEIGRKAGLQELHGYMKFKLLSISEGMCSAKPENMIGRITEYIARNYNRDIKLENLAALFNYNSTYLGKLFKSRTGQYFNTYLDTVRIEKAKHFLKEGFKVCQVAEKIGICDIDYFHKKFKKYTGLPPSAYKGKGE